MDKDRQLLELDIIMPILEKEAEIKGLKVFLFKDEQLREYYANANPEVGVVLLARDESSAKFNIQNLRRCYLVNLHTDKQDTCDTESLIEEATIVEDSH